jgi:hypothetical protein
VPPVLEAGCDRATGPRRISTRGGQVTELDGAVNALQSTLAGVDGDSLLSTLPAIIKVLEWIDTVWTALDQRIEQACG